MSEEHYREHIDTTIQEVSNLHLSGAIDAMGVVVVREDGTARVFLHTRPGKAFSLLGGIDLLHYDAIEMLKDERSYGLGERR